MLGTFVQVSLRRGSNADLERAAVSAFARIESVSSEMNFHDPSSDLSRLNQLSLGRWMKLRPSLGQVLDFSRRLQIESGGIFNIATGSPAASVGERSRPAFEIAGERVRRMLPLRLDLGGVAKGYAVDEAVAAIRRISPLIEGCVNAGGDLRVFGKSRQSVWIRKGVTNATLAETFSLRERAVATSSLRSDHRSPIGLKRPEPETTVTVLADSCMTADALAKIALLASAVVARRIAADHGATIRWAG